jgi:hypothetical protein
MRGLSVVEKEQAAPRKIGQDRRKRIGVGKGLPCMLVTPV